ncbi:TetR/AcrR family transcriptional regulator [Cupriavidus sp. 30B13]|uniref:TetR/AcrR family transcriptional regulator n=1 Tax=Cupriavidus sp. 30B13 TaxID=3384241 RepID=UPI003B8F2DB6
MTQPIPSARDRILETAARLFYRDGFRATGIDRIIAESGVAKMSLYRNFASKDELIAAFLDWRHDFWMRWFIEAVETRFARRAELSVIADALGEWFAQEDYRGCSFINVVAEAGATGSPGHLQQAVSHKQALEQFIAGIAMRLGLPSPATVAADAMLCVEGMIVRYQMTRDATVVESGRRVLAGIEEAATTGKRRVKVA